MSNGYSDSRRAVAAHHRIVLKGGGHVDVDRRWLEEGNYHDVTRCLEEHLGPGHVKDYVSRERNIP